MAWSISIINNMRNATAYASSSPFVLSLPPSPSNNQHAIRYSPIGAGL